MPDELLLIIGLAFAVLELAAIATSFHAVMEVRSSQGAIAWAVSLWTFPFVTLPLYWIFGRNKFEGYVDARRSGDSKLHHIATGLTAYVPEFGITLRENAPEALVVERLAKMPFTRKNGAELLIDGEATFDAIFAGIDAARNYILVQFYIVHDDALGREFKNRLVAKAGDGVRVYFLYDEIGCHKLPGAYLEDLTAGGVHVSAFNTTRGWTNRFRLNFRNHRKIVIVDGRTAFVGGHNVGDEYLGRDPKIGLWRDTHLKLAGPAVQCVQLSFLEDWHWATGEVPELTWNPRAAAGGNLNVLVLPSGPADELETCGLFFVHAIHSARKRVWIASPYFVPDEQVVAALQLAALRGVDVRIILPEKADHLLVYLSSFSYFEDIERVGVKFYRYLPGFLHHKVMVVDDAVATVGTANFDNRSFRINFEITIVVADTDFTAQASRMMEDDLANCREVESADLENRSFWFKLAVRVSRLMAPIQ